MGSDIEVRTSSIQGKGVFVLKDFAAGDEISRFPRGRLVDKKQVRTLKAEEKSHLGAVDGKTYEIMAVPARFVNHSCDPNTVEKVTSRAIVSFALRPIQKGEELTVDYRIRSEGDWRLKCACGSANCAGEIIGNFFSMSEELQKKYLPYAPVFIRE